MTNVLDDDDMGALWREHRRQAMERRKHNREQSIQLLRAADVQFTTHNGGAHLMIDDGQRGRIDYWPGTGLWVVRSSQRRMRGVKALLRFLRATPAQEDTPCAR